MTEQEFQIVDALTRIRAARDILSPAFVHIAIDAIGYEKVVTSLSVWEERLQQMCNDAQVKALEEPTK